MGQRRKRGNTICCAFPLYSLREISLLIVKPHLETGTFFDANGSRVQRQPISLEPLNTFKDILFLVVGATYAKEEPVLISMTSGLLIIVLLLLLLIYALNQQFSKYSWELPDVPKILSEGP